MWQITTDGGEVRFSFLATDPPGRDLVVDVEISTTLMDEAPGGWNVVASRTGTGPWTGSSPVSLTPAGNGQEWVTISESITTEPRRFYRLKVREAP